jgi:hypothetical protein
MPEELADIEMTGRLINRGSAEGKYFSATAEGASLYAKQAYYGFHDPPYTLVETEIPEHLLTPSMCVTVDEKIPAVLVPDELLLRLTPRVQPTMPIPLPQ